MNKLKGRLRGIFMIRNLAALISLAVVFSGSFALSTQSVEAKTSRNNSHRDRNYLVPPPPPYTPSLVPSVLGSKYIFTRIQSDMPQVVQPNANVSEHSGVETKIQKEIDYFDSEISSSEKEIGKLLNL